MFNVTPEIYGQLLEQIESAVEGQWDPDYRDPDTVKGEAEVEVGDYLCTLSFSAYPSYRYEEINPGIYGPDGQWAWVLTRISIDCGKFTVTDEDGNELENDFSSDEVKELTY